DLDAVAGPDDVAATAAGRRAAGAGAGSAVATLLEARGDERAGVVVGLLAALARLAGVLGVGARRGAGVADRDGEERRGELDRVGAVLGDVGADELAVEVEAADGVTLRCLAEKRLGAVRRDVRGGGDRGLLELGAREPLDLAEAAPLTRGEEG